MSAPNDSQQAILDAQWDKIADKVAAKLAATLAFVAADSTRQDVANKVADSLTGTGDKAVAFRAAVAADVWAEKLKSFDGQDYPASQFLQSVNEHTAPVSK